jgi:hypothetical protein
MNTLLKESHDQVHRSVSAVAYFMDFARVGGFHMQASLLATKTASLINKETFTMVKVQREISRSFCPFQ